MDVSHIHKIPSQQHLDEYLVESLETGPAELTPRTDHHCTCQAFCFAKSQHLYCYYCLLQSTWVYIEVHYIWGAMSSREKGVSFKDINSLDALPWPVIIWGMGLGTDLSQKDRLHILELFRPPSEWAGCEAQWCQRVSDCCFLLQVAYVLQDWWLAFWWVILGLTQSTVKSKQRKPHFPTESGGEMGQVQPPLLTLL